MKFISMTANAAGYLLIFSPPLLFLIGLISGAHGLSFWCLIFVFPCLRVVFGDVSFEIIPWSELMATVLEFFPNVCAVFYWGVILYLMWHLHVTEINLQEYVWLGLGLWATFIFASCVSHELLHRRSFTSKMLGRILSGMIGYPFLEHEHLMHHLHLKGKHRKMQWPDVNESLWNFTFRRSVWVFRASWQGNLIAASRQNKKYFGGFFSSALTFLMTTLLFWLCGGVNALILYCVVAIGVFWTMQAITYIQHWGVCPGLGDDAADAFSWEDLCWVQAVLTLNVSFHQAHHDKSQISFYRQHPLRHSPKAPAGYIFLLFASMVPAVWRFLMVPALLRWKEDPLHQMTAGRKLFCINYSKNKIHKKL